MIATDRRRNDVQSRLELTMGVPVRIQRRLGGASLSSAGEVGGEGKRTHSALRVATAIDILALGFLMT